MPSSKKQRGRAKKEKKGGKGTRPNDGRETPAEGIYPNCSNMLANLSLEEKEGKCDHGFAIPSPDAGDVCAAYARAYEKALKDGVHMTEPFIAPCFVVGVHLCNNGFEGVWENSANNARISQYLVSLATDYMLMEGDDFIASKLMAQNLALGALLNEAKSNPDIDTGKAILKMCGDMDYESVTYLHKRIKCSCMKHKRNFVKNVYAEVTCLHCFQAKHRKEMKVCSKCGAANYCSRACQEANWPQHKTMCGK
ncbi:hypothetical protein ACHAXT_004492 [Thalassiosira profunda]